MRLHGLIVLAIAYFSSHIMKWNLSERICDGTYCRTGSLGDGCYHPRVARSCIGKLYLREDSTEVRRSIMQFLDMLLSLGKTVVIGITIVIVSIILILGFMFGLCVG